MEFRLLGQVGLEVGGSPVELLSAKRRGLLAVLLLSGNKPVSREHLTGRLWPEGSPSLSSLYKYVADLRALLGTDRLPRLGRDRYVLHADDRQVDYRRFTAKVSEARHSASSHQYARAIALVRSALSEWNGPALQGLKGIELDSHRAAMTSARRSAWTALVTLGQRFGDNEELLIDIRAARELWPRDDELFCLELRTLSALNRTGELRDSYDAYIDSGRNANERPSRQLTELFRELSANTTSRRQAGSAATPGPQMVPIHVPDLIGRTAELSRMTELLVSEPCGKLLMVVGAPGMGKTSLVLRWTAVNRIHFAGGMLWADLRGYSDQPPAGTDEVLHGFLTALGVAADQMPVRTEDRVNLFRALAAERRMLVLLDNARDIGQVRALLPGTPTCATVVTTRNTPWSLVVREGGELIGLDALSLDASLKLLRSRIGGARVDREHGVAIELVTLCGGLPLAISILAANAQIRPHISLAALLVDLRDERERLTTLSAAGADLDIRAVFTTSYRTLSDSARRLFQLIGLHWGPHITISTSAALFGDTEPSTQAALRELADGHLLTEVGDNRFVCHDLLGLFAAERAEAELTAHEREVAVDRLVSHYLRTAYACSLALNPLRRLPVEQEASQPDYDEAMAWFDTMADNLGAAVDHAQRTGRHKDCWMLAMTMAPHQWRRGAWAEAVRVQRLAAESGALTGTLVERAFVARTLANTYRKAGLHEQAHGQLVHAVALCREAGDSVAEADGWQALATNHTAVNELADAATCYQNARVLFEAAGDEVGLAYCLAGSAWVLNEQGDHTGALRHAERALELHRVLSDLDGEAATLDSLGLIHAAAGDHLRAIDHHTAALRLYESSQNDLNQARTLVDLGKAQQGAGLFTSARESWQTALDLFESMSHNAAEDVRRLLAEAG